MGWWSDLYTGMSSLFERAVRSLALAGHDLRQGAHPPWTRLDFNAKSLGVKDRVGHNCVPDSWEERAFKYGVA